MVKKFVLKKVSDKTFDEKISKIDESKLKIDYFNLLNPAQYEAVCTINGPVLVIAGAGTGKTRTLVYRVARLIELGIPPQSILLLTFTRKAAQEMLSRASKIIDARCEKVSGGTFHSFANLILRKFAQKLNLGNSFTILDQADAEDVLNLVRTNLGFDKTKKRFPKKSVLYDILSLSINKIETVEDVIEKQFPQYSELIDEINFLFNAYDEFKRKNSLLDYDDLLIKLKYLLEKDEEVRNYIHRTYKYIMVDEFQDTNKLQAELVLLLAGKHKNIMVVGDDSQSIYSFRGANFKNIMNFPSFFDDCKIIKLEENYRSTQAILDFTNQIIAGAKEKYDKVLFTRNEYGELPSIVSAETENHQSRFIVEKILELREQDIPLNDIAILFRSGFLSYDLEIELNKANIPFRKFGGLKFIETAHIKDLISLLRIINNPGDSVSWYRILLLLSGIGPQKAKKIIEKIQTINFKKIKEADLKEFNPAVNTLIELLRKASADSLKPADKLDLLIPFYEPLLREKYDDSSKRLKDLEIFHNISQNYRSLNSFLDSLAIDPPSSSLIDIETPGSETEYLTLSTIHSAKGLEWNTVFIINAIEGFFPSTFAAESIEDLEEERRLLYVAATRAKKNLFILYPLCMFDRQLGMTYTKKSRFLTTIDPKFIEEWIINEIED